MFYRDHSAEVAFAVAALHPSIISSQANLRRHMTAERSAQDVSSLYFAQIQGVDHALNVSWYGAFDLNRLAAKRV